MNERNQQKYLFGLSIVVLTILIYVMTLVSTFESGRWKGELQLVLFVFALIGFVEFGLYAMRKSQIGMKTLQVSSWRVFGMGILLTIGLSWLSLEIILRIGRTMFAGQSLILMAVMPVVIYVVVRALFWLVMRLK